MIKARFLSQLAAVAVLTVASSATSAGAVLADGASPTVSASVALSVSSASDPVLEPGELGWISASDNPGWACIYGYPCLYDGDSGTGDVLVMTCGRHDLGHVRRPDGSRLLNDWANSARTYGNTITVYNWDDAEGWQNWGTVPTWRNWNFQLKNQIDAVNVNCAS